MTSPPAWNSASSTSSLQPLAFCAVCFACSAQWKLLPLRKMTLPRIEPSHSASQWPINDNAGGQAPHLGLQVLCCETDVVLKVYVRICEVFWSRTVLLISTNHNHMIVQKWGFRILTRDPAAEFIWVLFPLHWHLWAMIGEMGPARKNDREPEVFVLEQGRPLQLAPQARASLTVPREHSWREEVHR